MSFIPPLDIPHPARRLDGFAIRRIKRFDLSNLGIYNPPVGNDLHLFNCQKLARFKKLPYLCG